MYTISQKGINQIKEHEGLRLKAYLCEGGKWTIGYGHTEGTHKEMVITAQKAEDFLRQDLKQAEKAVNMLVIVPLSQSMYDALVSFVFNLGSDSLRKSTLLKKLNNRDYAGAQTQFHVWKYAGGKVSNGLVARREREAKLFMSEGLSVDAFTLVPEDQPGLFARLKAWFRRFFGGRHV